MENDSTIEQAAQIEQQASHADTKSFYSSHAAFVDSFGGVCTLLSCCIAGYQIMQHLRYYSQPQIQLQIIRILAMIPVYSGATLFSILNPEWTLVCNTIRDIYEAYVLYIFMQLLVHYLGGENTLIVHLEFKRRIKQPWPLDKLRPLQTDKVFYRRVKQGVLQFVLIKPITSVLAIILDRYDMFCDGTYNLHCGFPWLAFINNISVSLSLYFLVLFYKATEERLAPFNPFYKFVTVKAILFFSFWQSCFFQIMTTMDLFSRDTGNVVLNLIISVEMVFAAIAQSMAFSYHDFADYRCISVPQSGTFTAHNQKSQGVCSALGQVLFSTRDVIEDAHSTFIKEIDEDQDRQLQLDELKRVKNSAFNWSDEELLGDIEDMTDVVYKDKYKKKKTNSQNAISQIKQTVQRGYTSAKAGLSTTFDKDPLGGHQTTRIVTSQSRAGAQDSSDDGDIETKHEQHEQHEHQQQVVELSEDVGLDTDSKDGLIQSDLFREDSKENLDDIDFGGYESAGNGGGVLQDDQQAQ